MPDAAGDEAGDRLHVRLPAHPSSVPTARQFVLDGLGTWGRLDLADDAALCVSELASNATLHGGGDGFFEVLMATRPGAVRIAVADDGPVPVEAVVSRPQGAGRAPDQLADEPATGRGLGIVARLADDWGVDPTSAGKSVWLRLASDADQSVPARRSAPTPASTGPVDLPDGWFAVRLQACPVALGLRQDQHLDELVRELQLIDAGARHASGALAAVIERLLGRQAHARHTGRRLALEADAAGLETIDIVMPVPAQAATDVRALQQSVLAADALCEAAELLTLASTPDVMSLRAWMVHELVRQIEAGAPPTTFAAWRAAGEPAAPGPPDPPDPPAVPGPGAPGPVDRA